MTHYRTIFISDVHLGTRTCQADLLSEFLRDNDADTYYLVGDIVDFWRIRRGAVWPKSHSEVLQKLLVRAQNGARVVFIPGNHDEGLRAYCGSKFGNVEIERDAVFETATGKRYLVAHGDEFDVVMQKARWLAIVGDWAYQFAIMLNWPVNLGRRLFGREYWSLSAYLKGRVKSAVNVMGDYESALSAEATKRDVDGVICGHIHRAASKQIADIHYVNTGDWMESATAFVECQDGSLEMIRWLEQPASDASELPAPGHTNIGVAA